MMFLPLLIDTRFSALVISQRRAVASAPVKAGKRQRNASGEPVAIVGAQRLG